MSEDIELDDRLHSALSDPHGTAATGDSLDRVYWGWEHNACVNFCRCPRCQVGKPRQGGFCSCCGGRQVNRTIHNTRIDPEPTRLERFGWWCGGWLAALWDAFQHLRLHAPRHDRVFHCCGHAAHWSVETGE